MAKDNSSKVFSLDEQILTDTIIVPNGVEVFNFKDDLVRKYDNIVFPKTIKEINGDFEGIAKSGKKFTTNFLFNSGSDVGALKNLLAPYVCGSDNGSSKGVTVRELIAANKITVAGDIDYALDIVIGGNSSSSNDKSYKTIAEASEMIKGMDNVKFSITIY